MWLSNVMWCAEVISCGMTEGYRGLGTLLCRLDSQFYFTGPQNEGGQRGSWLESVGGIRPGGLWGNSESVWEAYRDIGFGPKEGQICPIWDKSGNFSRSVFSTFWLIGPGFDPFGATLTHFEPTSDQLGDIASCDVGQSGCVSESRGAMFHWAHKTFACISRRTTLAHSSMWAPPELPAYPSYFVHGVLMSYIILHNMS